MRLSGESKLFVGIFLVTIIIIGIAVLFFSQPAATYSKEELLPSGVVTKGNVQAKVYLVEFSDFQCPACVSYKPTVDKIVEENKDKMLFGYRHFPLSQHQFALPAAYASEAALEQGKFWEMYDFLFTNQENLADDKMKEGAQKIGLDMNKFDDAIKSETIQNKVTKDMTDGNKFGVDATPTFFLNGSKLDLLNKDDLENAVKKAISSS
ncbi:MAG: hypothetical protein EPN88_00015 [Bacteroidetes bacterium]|nr:MAG: hypothetical protein EPN88_00015 [Bacteroidota bacterium]